MTSDNFTQFLKSPSHLYKVTYEELKTLVMQYPYCQNLRYLLLKKSQVEQHPEYERNLAMAATYSVDRNYLYEQLYAQDTILEQVEKLEAQEEEVLDLQTVKEEAQKEKVLLPVGEETKEKITTTIPKFEENIETPVKLKGDKVSDEMQADTSPSKIINQLLTTEEEPLEELDFSGSQISEKGIDSKTNTIVTIINPLFEAIKTKKAEQEEKVKEVTELEIDIDEILTETIKEAEELMTNSPPVIIPLAIKELSTVEDKEEPTLEERPVTLESISEIEETKKDEQDNTLDLSPVKQEDLDDIFEIEESFNTAEQEEDDAENASFSSWIKQFENQNVSIEIEDLNKAENDKSSYKYEMIDGEWKQIKKKAKKKKKKKKKKKSKEEQVAEKSVILGDSIATKTLAQLLEKQGHYEKAIEMYERLRLENPQKSELFVAKIQKLKKLIEKE